MEIEDLPDSILLNILTYLTSPYDISNFGQCCRKCNRVAKDDLLWRGLFHQYFRVQNYFSKPLAHALWRDEFVRMLDETPLVEVQLIKAHQDQVLHVSFSKNGEMFCTTSKDAQVLVWTSDHPVKLKWEYSMKKFQWKYTQYSEFNESDTLLLVSGVLFGLQSTSGEIVIFSVKDNFQIQCRIVNKPYDVFGTFISDNFFLSGDLTWLGSLVSKTQIWLNKASQEIESEHTAIMNKMFKFYNPSASSVRSLMIANVVRDTVEEGIENNQESEEQRQGASSSGADLKNLGNDGNSNKEKHEIGNRPSSHSLLRQVQKEINLVDEEEIRSFLRSENDNVADINYSPEFYSYLKEIEKNGSMKPEMFKKNFSANDYGGESSKSKFKNLNNEELKIQLDKDSYETFYDEIIDTKDKYLIFTCGQKTYTPHQIGFRKIGKDHRFKGRIDCSISLDERIKELKRRKLLENSGQAVDDIEIDYSNYPKVEHLFDKIDHTIDLHGHIIGMKLSPDHKYLYVNSRPWPINYIISDPLNPPPIAQEIDVHCIDMVTLRQVGTMRRCHKGYTPNDECFFLFLDTSELYLGSGAEDKHGYIWDRLYGISICKLPHADVVNCVGFCPKDSELLVSVSDDNTIKIWKSKRKCRELGIDYTDKNHGIKLYNKK